MADLGLDDRIFPDTCAEGVFGPSGVSTEYGVATPPTGAPVYRPSPCHPLG